MKDFLLSFTFKGTRNYIQGPDIYTKILEYLNTEQFRISNIELSFHKIVRNNLRGKLFRAENINSDVSNAACIFKFTNNLAEPYVIHLFETDDEVTESHPYYEEKIVDAASLNIAEKSILLASPTPYNNIEKIVALNKALLSQLLTDPGKWYFTKITIDKDVNHQNPDLIALKLVKNIGSKITKTVILFDDKEQGFIYFSKV
jgi:hypothetical protein